MTEGEMKANIVLSYDNNFCGKFFVENLRIFVKMWSQFLHLVNKRPSRISARLE